MYSFYGGKQGRTYHIVERFTSVQQMVQAFNLGGAYIDVNYGEYVIIDTISKSDPQNGLLFRRGFDYNEDYNQAKPDINQYYEEVSQGQSNNTIRQLKQSWYSDWDTWVNAVGGGAIYVGQIVGPKGDAPQIDLIQWEEIPNSSAVDTQIPISESKGIDIEAEGENRYNDTVKAASYTLKDTYGNIIGAQLAFDIPQTIVRVTGQSVDPYGTTDQIHTDLFNNEDELNENNDNNYQAEYDSSTNIWKYTNLIHEHSQSGNGVHPFYHDYNIAIPHGIKGQEVIQIKQQLGKSIDPNLGTQNYVTSEKDSNNNPIVEEDQYLTFTIRNYDETAEGVDTAHVGRLPYRVINNIIFATANREFLDDPSETINVEVGQIYAFKKQFGEHAGELSGCYALCIKEGSWSSLDIFPSDPEVAIATSIDVIATGETEDNTAVWRLVRLPQATTASLSVDYLAGPDSEPIEARFLDYIYMDSDCRIFIAYSTGEKEYIGYINSIENIIEKDGVISITFTGQNEPRDFIINTIIDIQPYGDYLCVLYSDPKVRRNIYESNDSYVFLKYSNVDHDSKYYWGPDGLAQWDKFGDSGVWAIGGDYYGKLCYKKFAHAPTYHFQGVYDPRDLVDNQYPEVLNDDYTWGKIANGVENQEEENGDKLYSNRAGWLITTETEKISYNEESGVNEFYIQYNYYYFDYQDNTPFGKHTVGIIHENDNDEFEEIEYPTKWKLFDTKTVLASGGFNNDKVYLISQPNNQDNSIPKESDGLLDTHGLWFVLSHGHHYSGE